MSVLAVTPPSDLVAEFRGLEDAPVGLTPAARALDRLRLAPVGGRHAALLRAASCLVRELHAGGASRELADMACEAVRKALRDRESRLCAIGHNTYKTDWPDSDCVIAGAIELAYEQPRRALEDWAHLADGVSLAEPLPPARWVSPGLQLGPGRCALFAGYGASAKTLALQSLALSVATGQLIWGRFACVRGKVVHLDYEQGRYATNRRYQRLARALGVNLASIGKDLRVGSHPDLCLTAEGMEAALFELVQGAALLVIDSLRAATPGVDENESRIRDYLQILTRVSDATGCAVLLIHHARKPSEGDGDVRTILRGSSAIFDAAGSVYAICNGKTSKDPRRVDHAKSPAEAEGAPIDAFHLLVEDVDDDGVRVVARDLPSIACKLADHKKKVFELVRETGAEGASRSFIRSHAGMARGSADDALDALVSSGHIGLSDKSYRAIASDFSAHTAQPASVKYLDQFQGAT
jgi:hypothetical protein